MLEETIESHLDCQEIKSVHPKGNQPWIFTRRADAEAEAETPILWPPMQKADSLEKSLMLGKTEGRRKRGWQRTRWLDDIIYSMDMSLSELREIEEDKEAWCAAIHRVPGSQTWLSNWTTVTITQLIPFTCFALSPPPFLYVFVFYWFVYVFCFFFARFVFFRFLIQVKSHSIYLSLSDISLA